MAMNRVTNLVSVLLLSKLKAAVPVGQNSSQLPVYDIMVVYRPRHIA